jgi:hypothetical protein
MLTETNTDIVEILCRSVRVLTVEQLADRWFSHLKNPKESAQRAVRKLAREGFATRTHVMAVLIDVSEPLYLWDPETRQAPDFEKLSYRNGLRWNEPLVSTSVITATPKAHSVFGGYIRVEIRPSEIEHDIAVASCFLRFTRENSKRTSHWIPEDSINCERFFGKRPDAIIKTGGTETIVEVVGRAYRVSKLKDTFDRFSSYPLQLR